MKLSDIFRQFLFFVGSGVISFPYFLFNIIVIMQNFIFYFSRLRRLGFPCALRPKGLKRRDGILSAYLIQPFFSFLLETRSVSLRLPAFQAG